MTYEVIYADPPWNFGSKYKVGTLGKEQQSLDEFQYPTMKDSELLEYFATEVAPLASEDAVMIMWTTDAHLPVALKIGEAAGFTYKTVAFIWNKKTSRGNQVCFMSTWTMKGSEIALLFTKGRAHGLLKSRKVRQLVEAERREHSRKPDEVRDRIEEMFPETNKLELFARTSPRGWGVIGNETDKFKEG